MLPARPTSHLRRYRELLCHADAIADFDPFADADRDADNVCDRNGLGFGDAVGIWNGNADAIRNAHGLCVAVNSPVALYRRRLGTWQPSRLGRDGGAHLIAFFFRIAGLW